MFLPNPTPSPKTASEVPAIVRTLSRSDVQWNRRLFRPPPLVVHVPKANFTGFSVPTKGTLPLL